MEDKPYPGKVRKRALNTLRWGEERDWPRSRSPLEVSGHGDLAVHQRLHHPADHLVEGPRHVLGEPPLEALLHLLPAWRERGREGGRAEVRTGSGGVSTSLRIQGGVWEAAWQRGSSLVHVEGQGDVLVLGEEQDQEVVAGLALLYRGVQADLESQGEVRARKPPTHPRCPPGGGLSRSRSPRRTSGAGPCAGAGRGAARWCRGSCSRRSCRAGAGRWGRCGCRSARAASGTAAPGRCRWRLRWPGSRPPWTARSGRRPAREAVTKGVPRCHPPPSGQPHAPPRGPRRPPGWGARRTGPP